MASTAAPMEASTTHEGAFGLESLFGSDPDLTVKLEQGEDQPELVAGSTVRSTARRPSLVTVLLYPFFTAIYDQLYAKKHALYPFSLSLTL
jgi:hypothetical protein